MRAAVVVPVRGGDAGTAGNLRAIAAAGLPTIVVDNGVAVSLAGVPGVEVVHCPVPGSYHARNAGVAAALRHHVDAVLFTDADCLPAAGWPAHLLEHLATADIVTAVAPPRPESLLALGAAADYRTRFTSWAGGPVRCGVPITTMDTRACAVRAEVLAESRFDTRLRFAGDALFGRTAAERGRRLVGCHHPVLSHDPPRSWTGELAKYHHIAAALAADLRALPRRDVLRLLPEHAHLLLPARFDRRADEQRLRDAAGSAHPDDTASAERLYAAVRTLGWHLGWAGLSPVDTWLPADKEVVG